MRVIAVAACIVMLIMIWVAGIGALEIMLYGAERLTP